MTPFLHLISSRSRGDFLKRSIKGGKSNMSNENLSPTPDDPASNPQKQGSQPSPCAAVDN